MVEWDTGTERVTALEADLEQCQNCDPDTHESSHFSSVIQGLSKLLSKWSLNKRTKNVPLIQVRKVASKAHNMKCRRNVAFKIRLLDIAQWPSLQYLGQLLGALVLPFFFNVTVQL